MKVLIIDNNPVNRKRMAQMIQEQRTITVSGCLEAPNRIMGSMLIEAIDFDLVIIGGGLNNILPDGSEDCGNGITLTEQLLERNASANVVLWSDKDDLRTQFQALLTRYKSTAPDYLCWGKRIMLEDIEEYLLLIYQKPWGHLGKGSENRDVLY